MIIRINGMKTEPVTTPVVHQDLHPNEWDMYYQIKQIITMAFITLALFMAIKSGAFLLLGIKAAHAFINQL